MLRLWKKNSEGYKNFTLYWIKIQNVIWGRALSDPNFLALQDK